MNYEPHQQRVIDEKLQNDERAQKLTAFISESPIFPTLPPAEQERMKEQNEIMWQLSEILGKRIQAFKGEAEPVTSPENSLTFSYVTRTNKDFAATLLLTDPITHEALCPVQAPEDIDGALVLVVGNRDGSRRWKHSIRTEEL